MSTKLNVFAALVVAVFLIFGMGDRATAADNSYYMWWATGFDEDDTYRAGTSSDLPYMGTWDTSSMPTNYCRRTAPGTSGVGTSAGSLDCDSGTTTTGEFYEIDLSETGVSADGWGFCFTVLVTSSTGETEDMLSFQDASGVDILMLRKSGSYLIGTTASSGDINLVSWTLGEPHRVCLRALTSTIHKDLHVWIDPPVNGATEANADYSNLNYDFEQLSVDLGQIKVQAIDVSDDHNQAFDDFILMQYVWSVGADFTMNEMSQLRVFGMQPNGQQGESGTTVNGDCSGDTGVNAWKCLDGRYQEPGRAKTANPRSFIVLNADTEYQRSHFAAADSDALKYYDTMGVLVCAHVRENGTGTRQDAEFGDDTGCCTTVAENSLPTTVDRVDQKCWWLATKKNGTDWDKAGLDAFYAGFTKTVGTAALHIETIFANHIVKVGGRRTW